MSDFNSALLVIQLIAAALSLYCLNARGRWEISILCVAAWLVSCFAVFGADTGNWLIATFYFLLFLWFTIETYHDIMAEIDFKDNPWI